MKDIEIVVFNDKSWVRLAEYQELIEKMKCCGNCKHCDSDNPCRFYRENRQCDNYVFWELAE